MKNKIVALLFICLLLAGGLLLFLPRLERQENKTAKTGSAALVCEWPPAGSSPAFGTVASVKEITDRILADTAANAARPDAQQAADPELRAVWFSYLDWQNCLTGKSEADFKAALKTIFESLKKLSLNTIVVQVSPFGDAVYPSDLLYPSAYVSGTLGRAADFDALELFVKAAKEYGVALHAWFNPMRTLTDDQFRSLSDAYQTRRWWADEENRYRYMIRDNTGRWWLNCANPEVRAFIAKAMAQAATRYDVAAIHIDDYFYPSSWDQTADLRYYEESGISESVADWRRSSTSVLIREIYAAVKDARKSVLFGVSPQGNFDSNYNNMYIDVEEWLSNEGYVDYIMPQLYYGFLNENAPFAQTLERWSGLIKRENVKLYVGLACYKIASEEDQNAGSGKKEWWESYQTDNDLLKRQILCIRENPRAEGFCFYDYKSLFDENGAYRDVIRKEADNVLAVIGSAN